jgi:hypothetical protein
VGLGGRQPIPVDDVPTAKDAPTHVRMPPVHARVEKRHGHAAAVETRQADLGTASTSRPELGSRQGVRAHGRGVDGTNGVDPSHAGCPVELGHGARVEESGETVHGSREHEFAFQADPTTRERFQE